MSDREVKTRQTFSAFAKDRWGNLDGSTYNARLETWNAALASVILPEGRFEVGQKVEMQYSTQGKWVQGHIIANDGEMTQTHPECVRPLPTTVELTVNEKIREVATAMLNKIEPTTSDAVAHDLIGIHIEISQSLANGKTLDQLCSEYGVSTTKELS